MEYDRKISRLLEWAMFRMEEDARRLRRSNQQVGEEAGASEKLTRQERLQLMEKLGDPDVHVRLEAAKVLCKDDPSVCAALVRLVENEDLSVRWAAMELLAHCRREAIRPMLEALTRDFESSNLRQGVHHVMHELYLHHELNDAETAVYHALEHQSPALHIARCANNALIADARMSL
jgi:HEAT repeat protein